MWRSLVAHLTGGQGVAGSNPVIPTSFRFWGSTRDPNCTSLTTMPRHVLYFAVVLLFSACGSPTAPGGGGSAIQSLLDNSTPDLKVNGVTVQPGSTPNVGLGSRLTFHVEHTNSSGEVLRTGLLIVRRGVERLDSCAVTPSGAAGADFVSTTIGAGEEGQTVRVFLLGGFNPDSQRCSLRSSPRSTQVNHANVQAQRLLVTLAVQ